MKTLIPMTAIAALIAGAAVQAQAQPRTELIGVAKAVSVAEQKLSARAFDADLDRERSALVYEISLVRAGQQIEADVDAVTGEIVRERTKRALRLPYRTSALNTAQSAPPLTQTIASIETATKGKVSGIGLERRAGRDYYEVELVGAQDRDILVNVQTGAITPMIDD
jgi:uncharacterized membrane protein YkoI